MFFLLYNGFRCENSTFYSAKLNQICRILIKNRRMGNLHAIIIQFYTIPQEKTLVNIFSAKFINILKKGVKRKDL